MIKIIGEPELTEWIKNNPDILSEDDIILLNNPKPFYSPHHPDFTRYMRAFRMLAYAKNKMNGLPDPLDIFDDYKGPILKKV